MTAYNLLQVEIQFAYKMECRKTGKLEKSARSKGVSCTMQPSEVFEGVSTSTSG